MILSAQQLRQLADQFPNNSKRHHHKIIRELALEVLQLRFQNQLLKTMVPGQVREPQLTPCEEDAA
jgi:hypothetical protein